MIHVPMSYLQRTTHQLYLERKRTKHVIKKKWQDVIWQWLSALRRPEEEMGGDKGALEKSNGSKQGRQPSRFSVLKSQFDALKTF